MLMVIAIHHEFQSIVHEAKAEARLFHDDGSRWWLSQRDLAYEFDAKVSQEAELTLVVEL